MIRLSAIGSYARLTMWLAPFFSCALAFSARESLALDQAELDAHRAAWESQNISDYDYFMQWQCRCFTNRPGLVSVRSDTIVSVLDANTFAPLLPQQFLTIDQSFDQLQQGLGRPGYFVFAEFDPLLHYPSFVRIDHPQIADEEVIYQARDLVAVPEPHGFTLATALCVVGVMMQGHRSRVARRCTGCHC